MPIHIILPTAILYDRVSHDMAIEGVMRQGVVEYNVRPTREDRGGLKLAYA
jgi:hypothetical protein